MCNKPYLDNALKQINERITVERLAKRVPVIGRMKQENEAMASIMGRCASVVQKHRLTILTEDETGLTVDGYDPQEAADEVTQTFQLLRMTAVRYQ